MVTSLSFSQSAYTSKKNENGVSVSSQIRGTDTRSEAEISMDCDVKAPEPTRARLTPIGSTNLRRMNRWLAPHRCSRLTSIYVNGRKLTYENEKSYQTVMEIILCRDIEIKQDIGRLLELGGLSLNGCHSIFDKKKSFGARNPILIDLTVSER